MALNLGGSAGAKITMKLFTKTLMGCALCALGVLGSVNAYAAAPQDAAVVYFTLLHNREGGDVNGVGNTQHVAQEIARQTNSDVMEIKVQKLYPPVYDDTADLARDELDEQARPALTSDGNPDVSAYEDIYLGFPCWWGSYPRAVATWLEGQDLAGKDIYVFVTHGGSRYGDSISDLESALPDSQIHRLMHISDRNCRNYSDEELAEEVADALAELE